MKREPTIKLVAPLPSPLTAKDLVHPGYGNADSGQFPNDRFDMHYTERFGWVIPTLHIRNPGRRSTSNTARTYAVAVKDGSICRVGLGPHIKQTVVVYVRKSRADAMKPLLDLRSKGTEQANEIRDVISTRRARGALRRSAFDDFFGRQK